MYGLTDNVGHDQFVADAVVLLIGFPFLLSLTLIATFTWFTDIGALRRGSHLPMMIEAGQRIETETIFRRMQGRRRWKAIPECIYDVCRLPGDR